MAQKIRSTIAAEIAADFPDNTIGAISAADLRAVTNDLNDSCFNLLSDIPVRIDQGGTGQITANNALNALLPSQAGNNGKILSTDGTNTLWTTGGGSQTPWLSNINGGGFNLTNVNEIDATIFKGQYTNAAHSAYINPDGSAVFGAGGLVITNTGSITGSNLSGTNTGNVTLGTASGLSLTGQALSLGLSGTAATGALSLTDWNTFNNKQAPITLTTTGTSGASTLVGSTLNIPVYAGGVTSVSNSDSSLTISPTTGAVVASLNTAHANTWTGQQTFGSAPVFSTLPQNQLLYPNGSGVVSSDPRLLWNPVTQILTDTGTLSVARGTSNLPGTVSTTSGSTTVTGVSTKFTTSFNPNGGDIIILSNGDAGTISFVTSDTILDITTTWPNNTSGLTYSSNSNTNGFIVEPNGWVGVGTMIPTNRLDVYCHGFEEMRIRNDTSFAYASFRMLNDTNTDSNSFFSAYTGSASGGIWTSGASGTQGALGTTAANPVTIATNGTQRIYISGASTSSAATKVGIGLSGNSGNVSAILHLRAGSATAGTAPLKINTMSALLTTAETNAFEVFGDKVYYTIPTGPQRTEFTLNDSALTSGRVPFAATNGRLNDSANLTYTSGTGLLVSDNLKLTTVGNALYVKEGTGGFQGIATMVAGVTTVTITGLLATDHCFINLRVPGGTLGNRIKAVCTTNTLTITSIGLTGTTNTLETSTYDYFITRAA